MIFKAGCKINLGLSILEKRPDGYHNIESVLYPVPWHDIIEVVPASNFSFSSSGIPIGGNIEDNLCVKAYRLMEKNYPISPVKIHLHKVIPFGAGLGGGSSDAVAVLKLIATISNLKISTSEFKSLAIELGSDCVFFIDNMPAMAKGTGVDLEPLKVSLKGFYLAIVKPNIHIPTSEAYNNIQEYTLGDRVLKAINQPIDNWKEFLFNDFEANAFQLYPQLEAIKTELYNSGAIYAAMTGSGSALFGIFKNPPPINWIRNMDYKIIKLPA